MSILLTIDVEDYFQVENLRPFFPLHTWNACDLRIEASTHRLLDLFDCHHVKATFFILGWIAQRCPGLVREVRNRGHEVASHGYHHQVTSELSKDELRDDLYRSKAILEDLTGEPVAGYRAPKFSLSGRVWELLGELGYRYDSSLNTFNKSFDSFTARFRTATAQHSRVETLSLTPHASRFMVTEIPVSNLRISRWMIPMGGGGYFRFWPPMLFEKGVSKILETEGRYVFYVHPWEIDTDQPRVEQATGLSRFRHYLNLDKTLDRLDHFLTRFKENRFMTCGEISKIENKLMS